MGWWANLQNDFQSGGGSQPTQDDTPPNLNWDAVGSVFDQAAQYAQPQQDTPPNLSWFGNIQQDYQNIEQNPQQYQQVGQQYDNSYDYSNPYSGPYTPANMPAQPQYTAPYSGPYMPWNMPENPAPADLPVQQAQANPLDVVNQVIGNASHAYDSSDYFGNIARALTQPFTPPPPPSVTPSSTPPNLKLPDLSRIGGNFGQDVVGNTFGGLDKAVSAGFGALGQAVRPIGGAVDELAGSNIPGLSQAAQGIRGVAENWASPILNSTFSAVGDIANGSMPQILQNANPFDSSSRDKVVAAKLGYVQDAYNNALASGMTDEQASQVAQNLDRKLGNFANLTEYSGLQKFGTFPALAQLGIMLADPVSNIGGELLLGGKLPKALTGEGRLADATFGKRLGTTMVDDGRGLGVMVPADRSIGDIANAAQNVLQYAAPIPLAGKLASGIGDVTGLSDLLSNTRDNLNKGGAAVNQFNVGSEKVVEAIDNYATQYGVSARTAVDQYLNNPDSGIYHETIGAPKEFTDKLRTVYESTPPDGVGTDSVLQPQQEMVAPTASQFGEDIQQTPGLVPGVTPTDPAAFSKAKSDYIDGVVTEKAQALQAADPTLSAEDAVVAAHNSADITGLKDNIQTPEDLTQAREADAASKAQPVPPEVAATNAKLDQQFQEAFTSKPRAEATPLNEKYLGTTLPPAKGATIDEFYGAVKQLKGIEEGTLTRTGTVDRPGLRPVKPFENVPVLGAPLRNFETLTHAIFARPFLNSFSRLIRDPLGNVVKLAIDSPGKLADVVMQQFRGGRDGTTTRYAELNGNSDVISTGHASAAADVTYSSGVKATGIKGFGANLWYYGSNIHNEVPALGIRLGGKAVSRLPGKTAKAIGGKLEVFTPTTAVEAFEQGMKDKLAKRVWVDHYDHLMRLEERKGTFDRIRQTNPGLENLTNKQLMDFASGKMPNGASIADYQEKLFNMANFSDKVLPDLEPVLSGKGGPVGDIIKQGYLDQLVPAVEKAKADIIKARDDDYAKAKRITNKKMRDSRANTILTLAQGKLDELERGIGPDHPIIKTLEDATRKAIDNHFVATAAVGVADPALIALAKKTAEEQMAFAIKNNDYFVAKANILDELNKRDIAAAQLRQPEAVPTAPQTRLPRSGNRAVELVVDEVSKKGDTAIRNRITEVEKKLEEHRSYLDWAIKENERAQKEGTKVYELDIKKARDSVELGEDLLQELQSRLSAPTKAPVGNLQQQALDWATNRYKKNDRTGVTESSAVDALNKSDSGRAMQLSFIKKWINDEPLPRSLEGKRLMYEDGKGTYWISSKSKLYNKDFEVPIGKQVEATPAKAPPVAPEPQVGNPTIEYAKHKQVELNLHDLIFKEGKRPTELGKVRARSLKDRTDTAGYMQDLFDAARKDGLSDDAIWQAAGQKQPTRLPSAEPAKPATPPVEAPATASRAADPAAIKAKMQDYYEQFFKTGGAKPSFDFSANEMRNGINGGAPLGDLKQRILEADAKIREITGGRFKLDLDTMTPIGVDGSSFAGKYLTELAGMKAPHDTIKSPLPPSLPPELKNMDMAKAIDTVKAHYGEDAMKSPAELGQVKWEAMLNELSEAFLGTKAVDPNVMAHKASGEWKEAHRLVDVAKDDITSRFSENKKINTADRAKTEGLQDQRQKAGQELLGVRNRIALASHAAAYKGVVEPFFDYRNKSTLDRALGSILPYQYWARQNFAYVARHLASHPAHYAAILNFYNQLEKENSDPNIPDYAKGDIGMWQNSDGSKILHEFSSIFPVNPLGSNDSIMQIVSPGDSTGRTVRNTDLGSILFGTDIKSAITGKVTGRDKGIIPSFIRPNPVFELAFKTGNVNKVMSLFGLTGGDNTTFGQDYPESTRAQKETSGFIPANPFYQEIGAATGITKALRGMGVIKGDLSPQSVVDEMLFGKNAGKPQTKMIEELTAMAQRKEITPEQAKLAIAAYKDGNWTPVALKALDAVQGENAGRRLLTSIGFTTVSVNSPRQQLATTLSKGLGDAKNATAGVVPQYDGDGKKIYQPSPTSQFYTDNPGASVLFSSGKNSTDIRQGVADDKTFAARSDLYAQLKAKSIDSRTFNLGMARLEAANPSFFKTYPNSSSPQQQLYSEQLDQFKTLEGNYASLSEQAYKLSQSGDKAGAAAIYNSREYKNAQTARQQYLDTNPDFKAQYEAYIKSKGGTIKEQDPAMQDYFDKLSTYQSIGNGTKYDELSKQAYDLSQKGDKAGAAAIYASDEYRNAKTSRDQFMKDNPAFKEQYIAFLKSKGQDYKEPDPVQQKYFDNLSQYQSIGGAAYDAKAKAVSDAYASGNTKLGGQLYKDPEYLAYKTARDVFMKDHPDFKAQYDAYNQEKYGTAPKAVNLGGTASTASRLPSSSTTAKKPFTPFTAAQKAAYGRSLGSSSGTPTAASTPFTKAQNAVYAKAIASGATKAAATTAARATPTTGTTASRLPSSSTGTSATFAPYTQAQKVGYAKAIAAGKTVAYAQAVARNIGAGTTPNAATNTGRDYVYNQPYLPQTAQAGTAKTTTPYSQEQKVGYAKAIAAGKGPAYAAAVARNIGAAQGGTGLPTSIVNAKTIANPNNASYTNNGSTVHATTVSRMLATYSPPKRTGSGGGGGSRSKTAKTTRLPAGTIRFSPGRQPKLPVRFG